MSKRFWRRWCLFLRRTRLEGELEEEMRFHVEMRAAENIVSGMAPSAARRSAALRFGSPTLLKEESRALWGFGSLESVVQDLRFALRVLRRSPGFTAVALVTLGLGIGANTAVFSLMDAVLLKSLPVPRPRELVVLRQVYGSRDVFPFSTAAFEGLRDSRDVLSGLSAFRPWPGFQINIDGDAELAFAQLVSGNYYAVLGVRALVGRTLTEQDEGPVAVLSHRYWRTRFAGDPKVVGRSLDVQGQAFTVVGVTPREFYGTQPGLAVDITLPLAVQPPSLPGLTSLLRNRNARWLYLIGRLRSGVSLAQARALLRVRWAQLAAPEPSGRPQPGVTLVLDSGAQGLNELRRQFSLPLRILMAAVGVVLLIACANLASLLLARSRTRQHEIGVRLALGAGRGRVARQLLTESILLAVAGGAAGVLLAYSGTDLLVAMMSRGRAPIVLDLRPDLRALGFAAALSVLTGVLFGVLPALGATKVDVHSRLRGGAPAVERATNRWGRVLVSSQVALLVLLLGLAGLFLRTLEKLRAVDAGFRKEHVLVLKLARGYRAAGGRALYEELQSRFGALPGVASVSLSMDTPLGGGLSYGAGISIPGRPPDGDDALQVYHNFVGPRFFETMGIPLLAGRDFDVRDDEGAPQRAVVSESVARRYFGGEDPLGRQIFFGTTPAEVVGVAGDVRYTSLRENAPQMVYRPYRQQPGGIGGLTFLVRATSGTTVLTPLLRGEVRAAARDLPVPSVFTLEDQIDGTLVEERLLAALSGFFGAVAALLASIGLYGTVAYTVVRRTREIGIRMAVGAHPGLVARMVLRESLAMVAAGLALGIPAALAAARIARGVIAGLLFGVSPADPATLAGATFVLVAIGLVAAYVPARRAARIDPMKALRHE